MVCCRRGTDPALPERIETLPAIVAAFIREREFFRTSTTYGCWPIALPMLLEPCGPAELRKPQKTRALAAVLRFR
jgi:hypothetical protein